MKRFTLSLIIALLLGLAGVAQAQHLTATDSSSMVNYFNVISGNAICTASGAPVSGCTGAGTGSLTALPSSITTSNIAAGGSSGAWTMSVSLAGIAVGTYTVEAEACVSTTSTQVGGCSGPSVPFAFSAVAVPSAPATPTLGP